jgi:hypothetical protein
MSNNKKNAKRVDSSKHASKTHEGKTMSARQDLDALMQATKDRQMIEKYQRLHGQGKLTTEQAQHFAQLLQKWSS